MSKQTKDMSSELAFSGVFAQKLALLARKMSLTITDVQNILDLLLYLLTDQEHTVHFNFNLSNLKKQNLSPYFLAVKILYQLEDTNATFTDFITVFDEMLWMGPPSRLNPHLVSELIITASSKKSSLCVFWIGVGLPSTIPVFASHKLSQYTFGKLQRFCEIHGNWNHRSMYLVIDGLVRHKLLNPMKKEPEEK